MRSSRTPATLAVLLLLPSCGDASGPAPRAERELPVLTASGPASVVGTSSGAGLSCTYPVQVRAEGPPRAFASWSGGARTLSSTGAPSQVRHDTLSAPEVWSLFGVDAISAGETQTATLASTLQVPHKATWVFNYRAGAKIGTVAYEALCVRAAAAQ